MDHPSKKVAQSKTTTFFPFLAAEVRAATPFIGLHILMMCHMVYQYSETDAAAASSQPSFLTTILHRNRYSADPQWEAYRSNMFLMLSTGVLWKLLTMMMGKPATFHIWSYGLGICVFTFRGDALFYMGIIMGWYYFTLCCGSKSWFPKSCWAIMIITLFLNEKYNHFAFLSDYMHGLIPIEFLKNSHRAFPYAQILNMTFLKLLSFSLDYTRTDQSKQLQSHKVKCNLCTSKQYCQRGRDYMRPTTFNNLKNYLNYILFPPTLLTGPPITYNNFHSFQIMQTQKAPSYKNWILAIVGFEVYQHLFPVIALRQQQTLIEMQVFSLFHLIYIWYKFLVIWRTARLWSLFYGIDVVDNLTRCICNNYGFEGFWRMWHRGFNQWLIRYLYVPLGGNQNIFSVVVVVIFVAFWHDHRLSIVLWALIIIVFMVPEISIKRLFRTSFPQLYEFHWFKYASAFVSAIYILLLATANLIGFGYGISKAQLFWRKIQQEWTQLAYSLFVLTIAVILMFYKRNIEGNQQNY